MSENRTEEREEQTMRTFVQQTVILMLVFFFSLLGIRDVQTAPKEAEERNHKITEDAPSFPFNATVTTLVTTEFSLEGLTADNAGNLYSTGRPGVTTTPAPVYRINIAAKTVETIGIVVGSTGTLAGITFDAFGNLYIADGGGDKVFKLPAGSTATTQATVFATGVPRANGLAFDKSGNLWITDGNTTQGIIWKVPPSGGTGQEIFRIPPMRNSQRLGGKVSNTLGGLVTGGDGVGRQSRNFPPGTPSLAVGGQDIVANGIAFDSNGNMYIADTARGAIWKVQFDADGNLISPKTLDATYNDNALSLDNVFATDPLLLGPAVDGIVLDSAGNILCAVNGRQAIVVVSADGKKVTEIYRNPPAADLLRSHADTAAGNNRILEFPTSPIFAGHKLYIAQSDFSNRDNFPNTGGEIKPAGPQRGKISVVDQDMPFEGLPLPIQ